MNKQIQAYSTERLELIATSLVHINSELNSPNLLAQILNVEISTEWPPGEYDRNAQEYFRDQLKKRGEDLVGWLNWYAVKRASEKQPAILIAAAGYFGPPSEYGDVEIGYSVIPSYQGKGYATEIVQALVEIAKKDSRVKRIVARTTDSNKASCIVLEKTGFINVGSCDSENNILFEKIIKYT
jgi:[ribosomal protein S5]-alanine N-acetyltransferase